MKRAWDRLVAVQRHYERAEGDIYAAAITYFTIFALFPLLMMAFAVVGFVLASRPSLLAEIDSRVKAAVPAFEQLGLPEVLKEIAESPRGIVLLAGTCGPHDVVEEQVVAVRGGEAGQLESWSVHDDRLELADL